MRAELNAIEGQTVRLRRARRGLNARVTLLLVYVTVFLLWVASCAPFERPEAHCVASPVVVSVVGEGSTEQRGPESASRSGVRPAPVAAAARDSVGPDSTLRFTLPGGGGLFMSVPTNLSGADAAFAAQVVGDYLMSLAWRTNPHQ